MTAHVEWNVVNSIEPLGRQMTELIKHVAEVRSSNHRIEKRLDDLSIRTERLEASISNLSARTERLEASVATLSARTERLEVGQAHLRSEVAAIHHKIAEYDVTHAKDMDRLIDLFSKE